MMRSVWTVNGTSGQNSEGKPSGSLPSSPTVGTVTPASTENTVRATIATSGAGTAVLTRGSNAMIAIAATTSGYTIQGTSIRCRIWVSTTKMAREFTNPTITERGMNRVS